MWLLRAVEFIVIVLLLYFVITQVFLPMFRGTPVLPIFRQENALLKELAKAREEVLDAKMKKEIQKIRKQAEVVEKENGTST
jgi:hypothetical protein